MLLPRPARETWDSGSFRLEPGVAVTLAVANPQGSCASAADWPGSQAPAADRQAPRASTVAPWDPRSQVAGRADDVVEARRVARDLASALARRAGFEVAVRDRGAIALVLDGTADDAESYRLEVSAKGVRLASPAPAGLFRGMHTLLQLLSVGDGPPRLPAVRIEDRPRFRWRGLHLDVSRHFFPAARVKEAIDWCALHKLNVFHWHLVDDQGWRLPVARFPRLTEIGGWRRDEGGGRYGGAYTTAEIRDVVAYAADRFVTVVPEIEMPGHARAALAAYPALSCRSTPLPVPSTWGIFEDVFCAGSDETFAFLEAVLEETAALFPGPFIHVGGDECPKARWNDCPRCRARLAAERLPDADALQAWFIRRIAGHLARLGKRLVGWDEILDGEGTVPGATLPSDAVVMSWRGFEGGMRAARLGHEVVMSPTSHCYLDHYQGPREAEPAAFPADLPLERAAEFEPVPPGLEADAAARILGGQGNTWTERMADWGHVEYMVFPRLCALAEVLWSPAEGWAGADFRARLLVHARRLESLGIRHGRLISP